MGNCRKGVKWSDLENKNTKTDGNPQTPKTNKWHSIFAERQEGGMQPSTNTGE